MKAQKKVSKKILELEHDLLVHSTRYIFHYSCRKSICSKNNVNNAIRDARTPSCTRNREPQFDIKNNCLICGKLGTLKKTSCSNLYRNGCWNTAKYIWCCDFKRRYWNAGPDIYNFMKIYLQLMQNIIKRVMQYTLAKQILGLY